MITIAGSQAFIGFIYLVASGLFILALTLSQALIALSGHRQAMTAWLVGLGAFLVTTAWATDALFLRVELGSIAGAAVSAAAMGWFFVQRMSRGVSAGSLARRAAAAVARRRSRSGGVILKTTRERPWSGYRTPPL